MLPPNESEIEQWLLETKRMTREQQSERLLHLIRGIGRRVNPDNGDVWLANQMMPVLVECLAADSAPLTAEEQERYNRLCTEMSAHMPISLRLIATVYNPRGTLRYFQALQTYVERLRLM